MFFTQAHQDRYGGVQNSANRRAEQDEQEDEDGAYAPEATGTQGQFVDL